MNEKIEIIDNIVTTIENWDKSLEEKIGNNQYDSYRITKKAIENCNSENPLYRTVDYLKNKIYLSLFEDLYCNLLLVYEHYNQSREYLSAEQTFNIYYTLNPNKLTPEKDRSIYSNIANKQRSKSKKIYDASQNNQDFNRNNASVDSFFRFAFDYKSDESSFIYDPIYFYRQSVINAELKEGKVLKKPSVPKSFCLYDAHLMQNLTIGDNRQSYIGKINNELKSDTKKNKKEKEDTGIYAFYYHLDEIEGLLNPDKKETNNLITTDQIMSNRIAFEKRYHMEFFGSLNNQLFSMLLTNAKPYEERLLPNHSQMKPTDFSKYNSMFYYSFLYNLMTYNINLNVLNENLEQFLDASRCVIINECLQHSLFFNDVINSHYYLNTVLNSFLSLLAGMKEVSGNPIFYRLNDLILSTETKNQIEKINNLQKANNNSIIYASEDIKLKPDELELFIFAIQYVKKKVDKYKETVSRYESNKYDLENSKNSILNSEHSESISLKTLIKTTVSL